MAEFPKKVWNGTTPTRPDLTASRNPDAADWRAITAEIQAVQKFLLVLAANIDTLPNLPETLTEVDDKLTALAAKANALSVPADVVAEVNTLKDHVAKYDTRQQHADLRASVKRMFMRLKQLDKSFKEFRTASTRAAESFENQVRNQLVRIERQATQRIKALEAQVKELQEFIEAPEID